MKFIENPSPFAIYESGSGYALLVGNEDLGVDESMCARSSAVRESPAL